MFESVASSPKTHGEATASRTQYGFRFGAAMFECVATLPEGRAVVRVTTDAGKTLDIYVSRTGRSLRAFCEGQEWHA